MYDTQNIVSLLEQIAQTNTPQSAQSMYQSILNAQYIEALQQYRSHTHYRIVAAQNFHIHPLRPHILLMKDIAQYAQDTGYTDDYFMLLANDQPNFPPEQKDPWCWIFNNLILDILQDQLYTTAQQLLTDSQIVIQDQSLLYHCIISQLYETVSTYTQLGQLKIHNTKKAQHNGITLPQQKTKHLHHILTNIHNKKSTYCTESFL